MFVFEYIIRGEKIKSPNIPAAFNVLLSEIKSLGLDIETQGDEMPIRNKEKFKGEK